MLQGAFRNSRLPGRATAKEPDLSEDPPPAPRDAVLRTGRLPGGAAAKEPDLGAGPPPAPGAPLRDLGEAPSARSALAWGRGVLSALSMPTVGGAARLLANRAASTRLDPAAFAVLALAVVFFVLVVMEMMTAHQEDVYEAAAHHAVPPPAQTQQARASGPLLPPQDCERMLTVPADAAGVWAAGGSRRVSVLDARGKFVLLLGVAPQAPPEAPRLVVAADPRGSAVLAHCACPGGDCPYYIYRQAGGLFATVSRGDEAYSDALRMIDPSLAPGTNRFVLAEFAGGNLTFDAPRKNGHIRVSDGGGELCAVVGAWSLGLAGAASSDDDEVRSRLVVRVRPRVDVGAVICGLFCMLQLMRLEQPSSQHLVRRLAPLDDNTELF